MESVKRFFGRGASAIDKQVQQGAQGASQFPNHARSIRNSYYNSGRNGCRCNMGRPTNGRPTNGRPTTMGRSNTQKRFNSATSGNPIFGIIKGLMPSGPATWV